MSEKLKLQRYEPFDKVMVRVSAIPFALFGDVVRDPDKVVNQLMERSDVQLAIATSSTSTWRAWNDGNANRQLTRTLARYLIRMATRPTPYGLCAHVGLSDFGESHEFDLNNVERSHYCRVDMGVVLELISELEKDAAIIPWLRFWANPLVVRSSDALHLLEPHTKSTATKERVVLRTSGVVKSIFELCRSEEASFQEILALFKNRGDQSSEKLAKTLSTLVSEGFLLTDLSPSLFDPNPFESLCADLEQRCPGHPRIEWLRDCRQAVNRLNQASITAGEFCDVAKLVSIKSNSTLQTDGWFRPSKTTIARSVGNELASCAELLLRMSPYPKGPSALVKYKEAFITRYGHTEEVPLLEMLDPEHGLGAPAIAEANPPDYDPARTSFLLLKYFECLKKHGTEWVLSEDDIHKLIREKSDSGARLQESLDIAAFVYAKDAVQINKGNYLLELSPNLGVANAGRHLARFSHLLSNAESFVFEDPGEIVRDTQLAAELVYLPTAGRTANLLLRRQIHESCIFWNTFPKDGLCIPPNEIVVGLYQNRFYLRRRNEARHINLVSNHMVNERQAPGFCRFLCLVNHDDFPLFTHFYWGVLESAPYLPRVRFGRVVLRPQEWKISEAQKQLYFGKGRERLDDYRREFGVPRHVFLTEGDNRLMLDLESKFCQAELLANVARNGGGSVVLQESLLGSNGVWCEQKGELFHSEVVVSVKQRTTARVEESNNNNNNPIGAPLDNPVRYLFGPGSEWFYVRLVCHESSLSHVARLAQDFAGKLIKDGLVLSWFFVRYADPLHELRVRFKLGEGSRKDARDRIIEWSTQLLCDRIVQRTQFDTYQRELNRYGGPEAIEICESIFALDSDLVLNLLNFSPLARKLDVLELGVLSSAVFLTLVERVRPGAFDLLKSVRERHEDTSYEYRTRKADLLLLLNSEVIRGVEVELQNQLVPMTQAIVSLAKLEQENKLTRRFALICIDLLHMNQNRLGVPRPVEPVVYELLRRTLIASQHIKKDAIG